MNLPAAALGPHVLPATATATDVQVLLDGGATSELDGPLGDRAGPADACDLPDYRAECLRREAADASTGCGGRPTVGDTEDVLGTLLADDAVGTGDTRGTHHKVRGGFAMDDELHPTPRDGVSSALFSSALFSSFYSVQMSISLSISLSLWFCSVTPARSLSCLSPDGKCERRG